MESRAWGEIVLVSSSSLVTVALGRTNKKVNFTPNELQHLSRLERRSVWLSAVSVAFTVLLVSSYCLRSWRPTYGDFLSPDWTAVATFSVGGTLPHHYVQKPSPGRSAPCCL